jgi:hypothetical protein
MFLRGRSVYRCGLFRARFPEATAPYFHGDVDSQKTDRWCVAGTVFFGSSCRPEGTKLLKLL